MENFRLMLNSTERILNSNRSKEDFQTMFLFCTEGVLLVSINIVYYVVLHMYFHSVDAQLHCQLPHFR